jgi:hypothetical protein
MLGALSLKKMINFKQLGTMNKRYEQMKTNLSNSFLQNRIQQQFLHP